MPKKFVGENSKAAAARARKEEKKDTENRKKAAAAEEALWRDDDDKSALKKQQKREEAERKRREQSAKKAEARALLEKEETEIKKAGGVSKQSSGTKKVTRAQIESTKSGGEGVKKTPAPVIETHLDKPVEENVNRAIGVDGLLVARNVTEAISILSVNDDTSVDKHPEKRMKAAYTAYEERRLAELRVENPTLRMSQLKQSIFKEWQKSPENPLNATSN